MENSKVINKIINDIQIVNRDLDKINSQSYESLSIDSARLVVAAGTNVLTSRRRNLLERLYVELHKELGHADSYRVDERV